MVEFSHEHHESKNISCFSGSIYVIHTTPHGTWMRAPGLCQIALGSQMFGLWIWVDNLMWPCDKLKSSLAYRDLQDSKCYISPRISRLVKQCNLTPQKSCFQKFNVSSNCCSWWDPLNLHPFFFVPPNNWVSAAAPWRNMFKFKGY